MMCDVMQVAIDCGFVSEPLGELQRQILIGSGRDELRGAGNLVKNAVHVDSGNTPWVPLAICSSLARTSSRRL